MGSSNGDSARGKIDEVLFSFSKVISEVPVFGEDSPQLLESCKKLTGIINDCCFLHGGFYIEEVGDKLTINDSLVELKENPVYGKLSEIMKTHFISRISFSSGVESGETKKLVHVFCLNKMGLSKETVEGEIKNGNFRHINVNKQSIEIVMDGGFSVEETEDSVTSAGKGKRILIVEDNEKLRTMYKEELIERGYDVKLASNGMEAMGCIEGNAPPDLMVLDVKMPGMSGLEVLEKMRQKKAHIPVIVATAYPAMKDDITIKTFPDLEFIQKPFSYDSLSKLIGKMLAE